MPNDNGSGASAVGAERQAIRIFGAALNESLVKISQAEQSSLVAMMAIVAVLASLPEMEKIDPARVGAMVGVLVRGRPDEEAIRDKVANVAARIITVAQQTRATLAQAATGAAQASNA